jgi:uncharacterized ferredoxin-like protein
VIILDGVEVVAKLMEISARTAPKARGQDYIVTKILSKEEIEKLSKEMIEKGRKNNEQWYIRDGTNLKNSQGLLLIGLKKIPESDKPIKIIDLGIAIGSAVKTASIHNVDNRIMFSVGQFAIKMDLIEAKMVYGIPLSVSGKSIYFDR